MEADFGQEKAPPSPKATDRQGAVIVTGAGQLALGAVMLPQEYGINRTNENQKILSMVNIGLGTSTMLLSVWNLITDRKPKEKPTTWKVYSFQTPDNNTGLAFSLTRKF